ncbi:uncharacterized protein LOC132562992 [Ylistrum balloti]|uniref:uncharacterized protein LOC132562992 n=1 Tax=Ylistrum balloti TaxID=509963 RepID=UPI0029059E17|nr:uncharacterized protein LOC132562992 [Ylistrum balloti]
MYHTIRLTVSCMIKLSALWLYVGIISNAISQETFNAETGQTYSMWENSTATDTNNTTITMVTGYQLSRVESGLTKGVIYSHRTAIIVIMSIFVSITLTITIAILMFCKKKNSVFILQKCEQETDTVYEMDDMNTECDFSDQELDIDSYNENLQGLRSQTYPKMSRLCEYELDSPVPGRTSCLDAKTSNHTSNSSIPKSKTFSGLRKNRNLRECDIMFALNKRRTFSRSDIKRPTSLPLSSSFSSSSSWYNYQSMVITADVEPWENSSSDLGLPNTSENNNTSLGENSKQFDQNDENFLSSARRSGMKDESFNERDEEMQACTPLLQSNSHNTSHKFLFPTKTNQEFVPKLFFSDQDTCYKPLLEPDQSFNHSNEQDLALPKTSQLPTEKLSTKQSSTSKGGLPQTPVTTVTTNVSTVTGSHSADKNKCELGTKPPISPDDIQGKLRFYWDNDS